MQFVEGIWVLWDESHSQNESLVVHEQIVTIGVRHDNKHAWVLSASYASPNAYFREDLWKYLIRLGGCVSFEWLLLGDFNQVLASSEKRGERTPNYRNMLSLSTILSVCSLADLG